MVRIAGSDIPNLSKIVDDAFDSIDDMFGCDVEFDDIGNDIEFEAIDDVEE